MKGRSPRDSPPVRTRPDNRYQAPAPDEAMTRSIRISRSPAQVWAFISDLTALSDWYDDWLSATPPAGVVPLAVGTRFQLHGWHTDAVCIIQRLEPGSRLEWLELTPGHPPTIVTFFVHPDGDDTTLVHTKAT